MISHEWLRPNKQHREKIQPNIGKRKRKDANKHAKESTKSATKYILKKENKASHVVQFCNGNCSASNVVVPMRK